MKEIGPLLALAEVIESADEPTWLLTWEDGIEVLADYDEEDQRITFSSYLGAMPEADDVALYKLLLSYNGIWHETGGVRTAISEGQGVLLYDVSAVNLDRTQMAVILPDFAAKTLLWRQLFEKRHSGDTRSETTSDEDALSDLLVSGIRV